MRCVFGVNTSGVCKRRQNTSNPDTVLTSDFVHFLSVSHGRAFPDRCADREERTLSIPIREPFLFKRGVFNIVKFLGQIRYRVKGFWSVCKYHAIMSANDFYVRVYSGHKGKFGHEFLEIEFRPDGKVGKSAIHLYTLFYTLFSFCRWIVSKFM